MNKPPLSTHRISFPASALLVSMLLSPGIWCEAHESSQAHSRLGVGAILFLDQTFPEDGLLFSPEARQRIVDGTVDEDDYEDGNLRSIKHFFNPKTGAGFPGFDSAPQRASDFWTSALQRYRSGDRVGGAHDLGRVLHLLQDMTSPAHVHLDAHITANLFHCRGDGDDFEIWGYCQDVGINAILQYISTVNLHDSVMRPPLLIGLERIFGNQPQRPTAIAGDINTGYTFIRNLANQVYDFTTFKVSLWDWLGQANNPGGGELKEMFPSLQEDAGYWRIDEMGFSQGVCNYAGQLPFYQSWWIMPGCRQRFVTEGFWIANVVDGEAYIENIGGGTLPSLSIPETLIPNRFNRPWYIARYGSSANSGRKSMLRIYGDVLYPAAVAHGAGLLQAFLDEAIMPKPITEKPSQLTGIDDAQLNGTVRPAGEPAVAWFEWGTSTTYGSTTPTQSVGSHRRLRASFHPPAHPGLHATNGRAIWPGQPYW